MLRSSNALGVMGVSLMFTLWTFLLSSGFGTLVASSDQGLVGASLFFLCLLLCAYFIAPIRYLAVLLLHEEVKRFMLDQSGSFLKQASQSKHTSNSFMKSVMGAAAKVQTSRGSHHSSDRSRSPSTDRSPSLGRSVSFRSSPSTLGASVLDRAQTTDGGALEDAPPVRVPSPASPHCADSAG